MKAIATIVLLIIFWWIGASGLVSMEDVGGWITSAQEKVEETRNE